jgi:hypothetical protein
LFDQLVGELQPISAGDTSEVSNFIERDLARPRQKKTLLVEVVKLLPKGQTATLEHILGIRELGQ